jgi:phospho-N-acetylmuramoyl-pentapeptide-transferase
MSLLVGLLLLSFVIHSVLYIPFIHVLYHFRLRRLKQVTRDAFNEVTPIFDKFHQKKVGTPVGGGILIILITSILFPLVFWILKYFWFSITSVHPIWSEVKILLFTFISFGLLGLTDDLKKTFVFGKSDFFGLRVRHKLIIEIILSVIIAWWLAFDLKIGILHIPFIGVIELGWLYIPFATLVIISFSNAFNITDGLDGLSTGVLMIALIAFWMLSSSILDTPLSLFIVLWLGGVISFLYYNIHPARLFLGDVGALSFGATLAVVGLILGKVPILTVVGGVYVIEVASSFLQLLSKKIFKRKLMSCAPFHLWLQYTGWEESKIVMRFWIVSIILAFIGLFLSGFSK